MMQPRFVWWFPVFWWWDLVQAIEIPTHIIIQTDACSFWNTHGGWWNVSTHDSRLPAQRLVSFETDCRSFSPSDVFVTRNSDSDTNVVWLHADEQVLSLGTNIRFRRGDDGPVLATMHENVWTAWTGTYSQYTFEDPHGTEWGISEKLELFGVRIEVTHPTQQHVLMQAHIPGIERLAADYFCHDAKWYVTFHASTTQDQRAAMALGITVKAVRDANRQDDGTVSGAPCHDVFWFLVAGMPVISIVIIVAVVWFFCIPVCRGKHAAGSISSYV